VVRFSRLTRLLSVSSAFTAVAMSAGEAFACPSCAGNPEGRIARFILVGLMIAAPYVATTVVVRFIRKGEAAFSPAPPSDPRAPARLSGEA
jgi:hypothetical protein